VIAQAEARLRGERRARDLLTLLTVSITTGDELHRVIRACPPDELAGLCRAVQKALERQPRSVR